MRGVSRFVVVTEPLPPYALTEPAFPLRALAVAVSRAPMGGVRESLMAALVGARLAAAAVGRDALPDALRSERAVAARHWLGALTLPPAARGAFALLVEASVAGEPAALSAALTKVIEVTAPNLDRKARWELDQLARTIAA